MNNKLIIDFEKIFDSKDFYLNIIAARAQFIANALSKNSPELFSWRNQIIKAHGIDPQTGDFFLPNLKIFDLDKEAQIYFLTGFLSKQINYKEALELATKAFDFAEKQYSEISLKLLAEFKENLEIFKILKRKFSIKIKINGKSYKNIIEKSIKSENILELFEENIKEIEINNNENINSKHDFLILQTDGASRGNPGKASIAFVILNSKNEILAEKGEAIGIATNNKAEYIALIEGLKFLKNNFKVEKIKIQMDSELIVKQILGQYRAKDEDLKKFLAEVKINLQNFNWEIEHIRREFNKKADALCNQALDKN